VERNARSSALILRVCPLTVKVAVDLMSLELLPVLTSTGPGSMTRSPERPV
jgi:Flp pilus assembly protein TadB